MATEKVEYWTKRLEQTLTHTHTATKLIYTIEGAVIALGSYVLQTLEFSRTSIGFAAIPVLLLACLNGLHARFVVIQHSWYQAIDGELQSLVGATPVVHRVTRGRLGSTHGIHMWMHILITAFLLVLAGGMGLYAKGAFEELRPASPKPANSAGP